jgi:hypothetical protein
LVVAAAAAILAAAGCTSDAPSPADPAPVADTAEPRELVDLLAPPAEVRAASIRLMEREQVETAACMEHQGYPYEPVPVRSWVAALPSPDGAPEIRAAVGYGLRPSEAAVRNDEYARSLTAEENQAYSDALYGAETEAGEVERFGMTVTYPVDGCIAEARAAVYGSLDDYGMVALLPQIYRSRASARVAASEAYRRAMAAWPGCMSSRFGLDFDTPQALADHAQAESLETEVELATHDAECAEDVGILSAVVDVYEAYVDGLDRADAVALAEAAATFEEVAQQ